MSKNKLAGTKRGTSKSAKYFQENKEAREKKKEYDKLYHKSKFRKKYRALLNKVNRKKGTYGNGDGMDESHKKNGKTVKEPQSKNRARNGKGENSSKKS